MKRDVIDIVKDKEFIALTPEERKELAGLCNTEDEYNQLKHVLLGVDAMDWTNPQPKSETKESLDVLFAQTYPKAAGAWYSSTLALLVPKDKPFQRQPLLQIAALALLVFLTVPLLNSEDISEGKVVVAESRTEPEVTKTEQLTEEPEDEIVETNEVNLEVVTPISTPIPTVGSRSIPGDFTTSTAGAAAPASPCRGRRRWCNA